ncbi:unnamed protein product, partial [Hapterophycus canaliculatus]
MRMREGWEVWLLPNQATGKQGVPRYIKVDPATISESSKGDGTESADTTAEPSQNSEAETGQAPIVDDTKVSEEESSDGEAAKKEGEEPGAEPAVNKELQILKDGSETRKGDVKTEFEFTPTAPAWTPGGVATDLVQEQLSSQNSPTAVPPDENLEAVPQEIRGAAADRV